MFRSSLNSVWDYWENLHPILRFFLFCIFLSLIGFFGIRPGYKSFKVWRVNQNLAAAKVASSEVRMSDARDLSLTVLQAGDPRIDAFRVLEKSMESLRDPRHADIARALIQHPQSTDEDRLKGFSVLVREVPLALVGQAWAGLPSECRNQIGFTVLFADRLIDDRKYSEAVSILLSIQDTAKSDSVRQRLAKILVLSEKRQGLEEAQRKISENVVLPQADLNRWLDVFELIPPLALDSELLAPLREVLKSSSLKNPARESLALSRLDYVSDFTNRAGVIEKAIREWQFKEPAALAGFLANLGFYQRVEDLFPLDTSLKYPELLPILLNVYKQNSSWDKLNLLLDSKGFNTTKLETLAYRAFSAAYKGDAGSAAQNWSFALSEAKSSPVPAPYLTLHKMAEAWGLKDYAEQSMIEAIRDGKGPLPLYTDLNGLLNSLASQGRENLLLEICAIYLSFESSNVILLTQYAYLACLNNLADPEVVLKAMVPVATAFPNELPLQCVLASIYLAANQYANAAAAMDRLKIEPEKLNPSYRAIYFATQVLNQRLKKSDPKVVKFVLDSLLPSEKKNFTRLISLAKE
jgi:hypothetical protein